MKNGGWRKGRAGKEERSKAEQEREAVKEEEQKCRWRKRKVIC